MCDGSSPEVDTSYQDWSIKQAEKARKDEEARQNRVKYGMDQIRTIFEGGTAKTAKAAKRHLYDPKATYYNPDGSVWAPKATTGAQVPVTAKPAKPVKGAKAVAAPQPAPRSYYDADGDLRTDAGVYRRPTTAATAGRASAPTTRSLTPEEQFQRALKRGGLTTQGTGKYQRGVEPILTARRRAQERFYLPQLDEQHAEAKDELAYALTRAGLGVSTTANEKASKLAEGFNRERTGIMADIDADIAGARGDYEQQRQQIEAQLRASGDATVATDTALRGLSTFAQDTPELRPLENALLGLTQGIGSAKSAYDVASIRQRAQGGTVNRDLSRNVG